MSYTGKEPKFNRIAFEDVADNTSGSTVTLSSPTARVIRLTNASLVSIAGITATRDGDQVILQNDTGVTVTLLNESGSATAANRILTGKKANVSLLDEGSCILEYSSSESRWMSRTYFP